MKLKRWLLAWLALCLAAVPSWAFEIRTDTIGTVAGSGTATTNSFKIGSLDAPITIVVGYTSVATQIVNFSVEASLDGGTTWAPIGISNTTPGNAFTEAVTGTGGYIIFPFALVIDTGGSGTPDLLAVPADKIRVVVQNTGAGSITNLRVAVLGG